ncbi:hypothetical protein chiPu_0029361 [Chiloscyllium punctatum]|uniref:Peptidase S1 domain-containing protein n=1 Tax=Chiloscyllium punctatum TaxID=137246 RepID=A0A401TS06_CHIPU|nr:hypothetical protein [Chiloscyllium punctatum]
MPWTVLLKSAEGEVIDGTLIDHHWVLTSGHALQALNLSVVQLVETLRVYVGVEDARELDAKHLVHVEDVHYHPRAKDAFVYRNDLALVKLKEDIKYSNHIMPVCLPEHDYASQVGRVGYVGGWGEGADHAATSHLNYVALHVANDSACHDFFDTHHPGLFPPDATEQFCTEQEGAGHNVCPGDHGAALVVEDGGVFYAAGVLSHDQGCASEGYAIYADVYPFREWINKVTHPTEVAADAV